MAVKSGKMGLDLFPQPQSVTKKGGRLDLAGANWVVLPPHCSNVLRERIAEGCARLGRCLNRTIRLAVALPAEADVLLRLVSDVKRAKDQAYDLQIRMDGCMLAAGSDAGAFYGFMAFVQIIEQFGNRVPCLRVMDYPDFPVRGVMLDVSRCKVPTMETCYQLIDRLAGLRINQLQLYTEHTFAFAAHRSVWHDASAFTHEEILALDQYCADRFIELVPNLNSFGHMERWLRHPAYRQLGECPEMAGCSTLVPNRASLTFIESLYDEFLPHFRSGLFNVGCDETWELGKGRSKARADKTSSTQVYFDFLKKIHGLVEKKGRRMAFWGDIILHEPELIRELPEGILALCWGYEANHPYQAQCKSFAEAGVDFQVCPGTSSWNSITGRTENCLGNLESAARYGSQYGASGYLMTDWGDGGHHQVLPVSYLGFAAGAAYSWCLKANRGADFAEAISRAFFEDETGASGRFLVELGRALNWMPAYTCSNSSVFHHLLFRNRQKLAEQQVPRAQYRAAEQWLERIRSYLQVARICSEDRELVLGEFEHALAMARYALRRGRFVQWGDGLEADLERELQGVVMGHERQWLARNRPGGLRESSGILRGAGVPVLE